MISFLLVILVPLLIALACVIVYKGHVAPWEIALQVIAPLLVGVLAISAFTYSKMSATELWDGQITSRQSEHVSCSHSYSCHCHMGSSGSGKNRATSEHCDTCYEHLYDVDWSANTSTKEHFDVSRVDRQGLIPPPRWQAIYPGEPFASEHHYDNYLLLNKGTVLLGGEGDTAKFASLIPKYPHVYDIYKVNHVMVMGGLPVDQTTWNWLVEEANKKLGPAKQVNLLVVIAKTDNPSYVDALSSAWFGGQKNDVVVVIGSLDGHKVEFARVLSWTPKEDLKVELRDQIMGIGSLDKRNDIVDVISTNVATKFERMHMKQYRYLLASVDLGGAQLLGAFLLCLLIEGVITFFVIRNHMVNGGVRRDPWTSRNVYEY